MSSVLPMPLADLGETLRVVMPIIFVVIYGVAHLVGALQQEKKKRNERPRRPRPEAEPDPFAELRGERPKAQRPAGAPGEAARQQPTTLEDSLRREVEEFLKRAQGQRPQQQPVKRTSQPQRQRTQQAESPAERPARRLVESKPGTNRTSSEASKDAATIALPSAATVDAYVAQQMRSAGNIGQHAQRLGEEVAQADDRIVAQIHEKFDHQVGTLSPATPTVSKAESASSVAQEFREFLARPGGMRQIIIANEILRRPDERW
jgi:hypothetical protein